MNAHEGRSSGDAGLATGSTDFSAGAASPGQHRLVALELRGLQQPQVGRHDVADADPHDVAGHELRHVDGGLLAVPQRDDGMPEP